MPLVEILKNSQPLHVYMLEEPIDNWLGWTDERDFLIGLIDIDHRCGGVDLNCVAKYLHFRERALKAAWSVGWEGDIRPRNEYGDGGVRVVGLPGDEYMIAWKHENNGDTFIASLVRLRWLEAGSSGARRFA